MASISGKADASLPSSAEPSSESRPYKYDVYLSFWGADTREGFISTLYHRLQERGITTFKDVKVTTIEESRFAIEESRFAIVVLSQKYAAYTWCLEQLSKICEVMKDGPRILPVYYDVKPADVRKQRGSFEDALSKYEMSGRNESGKVQQWRDALTKVANLSGLDSRNYMDDIELINSIVEFVCSRVQPLVEIEKVQPMETDREGSDVSEETRQDMDEFREVHIDDEVSFVGVDGTGGLGKSTMVIPFGSSSSSAVKWKYDVFLSFRGEDTRWSFTSHLCHWLTKRGIKTFMDDQGLEVGDPISPNVLKAVEESRLAIVVLSPNYASSTWCLEELAKICQFMEGGHRILPVFYAVNSREVRYQKGSFQDAFTKHERFGRYGSEKVQQWREALRKVGSLSGWFAQDYKDEIEVIEAIVESVCSKIYTAGFEVFDAPRRAMDEVMKALKDEEVTAIGVYGVGGVGKTTMVQQVCAKVWDEWMFHHVVKAVVSKNPDLRKIQGTLADMLELELEEETEIGRSRRLMQKIRGGSRILIILDDIWESIDLSNIGIPSYDELQRCNSKVLLITRTHNVLYAMECQSNICLDVLSEEDSWTLFMNRARMSFESTNFYDVARKVARECAGLPIALIAVAKALGDKEDNWKEAAQRLKASQPANPEDGKVVFNCIKLSYDYLGSDDARSCFLLCCLFPEDYDIQIEDLLKYGMGKDLFQDSSTMQDARASAHSVFKYLRDCSLLLESEQDGCVKMHDVIRDVAIRISSSEDGQLIFVQAGCQLKEWPAMGAHESYSGLTQKEAEDYSAISLIKNKICKLPEKLVCWKLLILFLQSNVCLAEIPENFFQSLNMLRVLDLSQTRISLLPTSFNLLINLHTLCLDGCLSIINNISILGKLEKLEILSMRELPLLELPKEIGQLSNLRMLDITGEYVDIVPSEVIRNLHKLEELYMQCNFADWRSEVGKLPKEIGQLSNLRMLDITGEYVDIVPSELIRNLPRLVELSMQFADRRSEVGKLTKEIGHLSDLRMLDITGKYVDIVPSEVLRNLPNFVDWRSEVGTEVSGSKVDEAGEENIAAFDELTSLSRLNILKVFISDANCLPKVVGVEPKWISFDICVSGNSSIRKVSLVSNSSPGYTRALILGTTISALPGWFINAVTTKAEKLQYLTCWGLDNILVEYDRGRLHALKYFSVIGPSENLKVLMNTTTRVQNEPVFPNLEELHLIQVDCLEELCFGELPPGSLCNLRLLKVKHCYELVDALLTSQLLQRLQNLEKLICEEMDELEYVFGSEGLEPEQIDLTELKEMRLENLGKLIKIWNGPAPCTIFQNLQSLVVSKCFELKNLFTADVAQYLLQLEDLSVECCPLLDRVIEASNETMDSEIIFPKLKNLALVKLPQLTAFYGNNESATECPLLEYLNVERCPMFSTSGFTARTTSNLISNNIWTLYKEGV
uniref:TMV resistance protein N-like isoform X2 n=1 Tax=Fragaria vesca subsp. vesca TaxID=101020 RepID=UPI0005C8B243|nr:PREDICTED: TMV resistance protein N-like isoform X2 [Fragaria vesca subsp. vesca]